MEKLNNDLFYTKNMLLPLDLQIIFKTDQNRTFRKKRPIEAPQLDRI